VSSISRAQPHPRALEESFLVDLFVLEDNVDPLQGHYPKLTRQPQSGQGGKTYDYRRG